MIYFNEIYLIQTKYLSKNINFFLNHINFCSKSNKLYPWLYINAIICLFKRKLFHPRPWPKKVTWHLLLIPEQSLRGLRDSDSPPWRKPQWGYWASQMPHNAAEIHPLKGWCTVARGTSRAIPETGPKFLHDPVRRALQSRWTRESGGKA